MPEDFETAAPVSPEQTTEQATTDTQEAIQDIKEEVDKRDSAILDELKAIHDAIDRQTEHHVRHLEQHTVAASAPVQQVAQGDGETASPDLPQEPVSLEISEATDMPKEKSKEHKKSRKFGKRGRRA